MEAKVPPLTISVHAKRNDLIIILLMHPIEAIILGQDPGQPSLGLLRRSNVKAPHVQ